MRFGARAAVSLLTATLVLGGCGTDEPATPATDDATASLLDPEPPGLRERCGQRLLPPEVPVERVVLEGPARAQLVTAVFESPGARTALVLLPQITGGVCGWATFASEAADAGVSSVAVDLCGYGESTCPDDTVRADAAGQVRAAAEHARRALGATRVVVIGASMGGSQAVRAVAGGAPVDAWVDVSGPAVWDGDRLIDIADQVTSTGAAGMVVYARTDGETHFAEARTLARRTGATFVDGGAGHGWDLLTTFKGRLTKVGRLVVEFAAG